MADESEHAVPLLKETSELLTRLHSGVSLGRYVVKSRIGIGGMGVVFRATDTAEDEDVALKALLIPGDQRRPDALSRFRVQAALLAGLAHRSVVQVRDVGSAEDICYLVMPLVTGPEDESVSLGEYASWFGGVVEPKELLELFDLLLDAAGHFHAHKVIHGNLKPQNVLLKCASRTGGLWEADVMVSDFGLSRILGTDFVIESVRKTVRRQDLLAASAERRELPPDAKALLQTYDYMSPEQRRGRGSSRRSDVFSLGLMFLHLLTGKKVIGFQRPSQICSGIDSAWDAFILRATAQERLRRFTSVVEMRKALQQLSPS